MQCYSLATALAVLLGTATLSQGQDGACLTLHDLLNPPDQRPQTFHRGYDVLDPVKVGFKEPPPRPTGPNGTLTEPYFLFDTREKGNDNQGHTYGTQLSSQDKEKLLEYLKTL